MPTLLPLPGLDDMEPRPAQTSQGYEWTNHDGSPIVITVDNVVPGRNFSVTPRLTFARVAGGGLVTIIIGDTAASYPDGTREVTQFVTPTSSSFEILIVGASRVVLHLERTSIYETSTQPANPRPANTLALVALLPIPGLDAFRLAQSRLGRDSLTSPRVPEGLFELGRSRLATRRLFYTEGLKTWQDILPPCTHVATSRGVEASGAIRRARAGTLEATALDALDPRLTGMHRGTPIALIHWPTRRRLFTGRVVDLKVKRFKPGGRHAYNVEITAADAVAALVGITRYGARAETSSGQETWTARIDRLARSAPKDVPWQILLPNSTPMAPLVWETSLAKHLDAAVASVGGWWTADADGEVSIAPALVPPGDTGLVFTDAHDTDLTRGIWSYVDVDTRWQSSALITSITATNHSALAEEGSWEADDLEVTVEDASSAWAYGGSKVAVDTTLARVSDITPLLKTLLRASTENPPPGKVTLAAASRYGPPDRALHMTAAAQLDPMETAEVCSGGDRTSALIESVAHRITPTTWTTDLQLTTP